MESVNRITTAPSDRALKVPGQLDTQGLMSNRLPIKRCDFCSDGIVAPALDRLTLRAANGRTGVVYAWIGRCGKCRLAHVDLDTERVIAAAWARLERL